MTLDILLCDGYLRARQMDTVERITAFCPHCGNTAQQRLLTRHQHEAEVFDYKTGKKWEDGGPICEYAIYICETCSDLLVYHWQIDQGLSPGLVYPESVDFPHAVPNSVRECYAEAARVQKTAPNAYAVMIRRALEAICHDRGVTEASLHKGLEELSRRGEIPPVLAEMTAVLRQLGNEGAHKASKSLSVTLTWAMDEFFRAVIEYVYVAPSKLTRFKERLEGKMPRINTSPPPK